ncbi:hypothetical protein PV325_009003, partial [Microctonus aethiopoides]
YDERISRSTHPSKHAQTVKHRYNLDNKKSDNFKNNSSLSDVTSEKMIFRKSWMEYEPFRSWLCEDPHDSHSIFCLMCDKSMNASLSHIYRHAETVSHQKVAKIYVNEFLSSSTHDLYLKARDKAKHHKWKYVWIVDGRIYVRKDDDIDKINIRSYDDLDVIRSD